MRQSEDARSKQRELNRAYKESEHGRIKRRAHHAARKAVLRGAECSEADKKLMELIYKHCPAGYQVDHITPIAKGGKHRPDNLQYLPAEINNLKRARTDFDCSLHVIRWQDLVEPSTTIP
jgi:5-methylcytosine-specific restriction endonuclease McrA